MIKKVFYLFNPQYSGKNTSKFCKHEKKKIVIGSKHKRRRWPGLKIETLAKNKLKNDWNSHYSFFFYLTYWPLDNLRLWTTDLLEIVHDFCFIENIGGGRVTHMGFYLRKI